MGPSYAMAGFRGALIGLSAVLFLLHNGRVAGISGLVAGVTQRPSYRWASNLAFVLGLLAGPAFLALARGTWPVAHSVATLPVSAVAGLLVGFGTRLGSGCTLGCGALFGLGLALSGMVDPAIAGKTRGVSNDSI